MLEIRHLLALQYLRSTNSLSEVAQRLHLSTSALSHQIKQLEAYYQCTLFERKTKPTQFTQQGKALLDCADKILPHYHDAEHKLLFKNTLPPNNFHIALECHSCYHWLIPSINDFREAWPDVATDLSAEFHFQPLPKLINGQLDVVITADPIDDVSLHYEPLFDFEMMIGVSKNHALADKKIATPEDLRTETLLIYPVDQNRLSVFTRFLNPANIRPQKIHLVELTLMMMDLTSSGKGISALPNWVYAQYADLSPIATLQMGKTPVGCTLYIACRKEDKNKALIQDFIRIARQNCSDIPD